MKIEINNYPIDFTLEDEKTVEDIIESVIRWSGERELVFVEADIDGEIFRKDNLPEIPIENIERINCLVMSKADIIFTSVEEGYRYISKIVQFIDDSLENEVFNQGEIENLTLGIDWLNEVYNKVVDILTIDAETEKYRDNNYVYYIHKMNDIKGTLPSLTEENYGHVFSEMRELFFSLNDIFKLIITSGEMNDVIVKNIESPDVLLAAMKHILDDYENRLENIREAAIAFQTGKDNEGAERLNSFIDFIYQYTRSCFQMGPVFSISLGEVEVDGISLEEKNSEIQNLLNETLEIMENNDIISLSDMLEYEIIPALESLPAFINALFDKISGNEN